VKLIIQIPCFNEEKTLPVTISDLPKIIKGIDEIEYLIINDGSTDKTVEVARELGVHHVVSFPNNRGLARGFMAGIDACLKLGADIIVNTDGDNQYKAEYIEKLIQPILKGEADVVVGDRQIDDIEHFTFMKKKLQKIGSGVVRMASGCNVIDTTSGFRAYSRDAAMRLNVVSEYSYTLETIIDAGRKKLAIKCVPVRVNDPTRKSRLFKSIPSYISKSASTIIRTYTMYKPLKVFLSLSLVSFIIGFGIGLRYLYLVFQGQGAGNVQSLILAAIMIIISVQLAAFGILADATAANRKINDELLYRLKNLEYDKYKTPC
jgi:glycosyltransferase involved in cell wall biosynthesis